jgi:hypothetical protein
LSSAFCWFCEASVCLIVALAWSSDCVVALVMPVTLKTYQPNWVLTGPTSLPLLAEKTAASSDFSSEPFAWLASLPPWLLEAWSIEYFLATFAHG